MHRLWSHIGNYNKMPYVRTCLHKSKFIGLSVELQLFDDTELQDTLSFLAAVVPHPTRWERFEAHFDRLVRDSRTEISQSQLLSNLCLPSLHSLRLTFSDHTILGDDDGHFYQSWEMPNLRSLDIDIIPKLFEALKLSAALFRDFFITEGPAESERLSDFLTAFSNLEELDIAFNWRGTQGYHQAQMIEMPNLKRLSIGSPYSKRNEIRPFMVALRTPILCKSEISMVAPVSEDERSRALDDIFPHEDCSSVESLTLKNGRWKIHPISRTPQEVAWLTLFVVGFAEFCTLHS